MLTENKKHLLISFSSSKFFPKGPENTSKRQVSGAKHLELEHGPLIHDRGFKAQGDVEKSSEAEDEA